jgi:hypothetical protein
MKSCEERVPFEKLVDLWAGDLPPDEIQAVEEHIFRCDECAAAEAHLGRLIGAIEQMIPPVLSHLRRDRLLGQGMRILHTPVEVGLPASARFAPEVDLLVHVLHGDLSQADRVDLEMVGQNGVTYLDFQMVPFDPKAGEVLVACQRHFQAMGREYGGTDPLFRVHAVQGGVRRHVGDYFVHHIWE